MKPSLATGPKACEREHRGFKLKPWLALLCFPINHDLTGSGKGKET